MGNNPLAKARREIQALLQQVQELRSQLAVKSVNSAAVPTEQNQVEGGEKVSTGESFFRFLESGPFLAAIGIIGPLMIPVSSWFLALPAACFALSFHRAKVVRGKRFYVQVPSYILLLALGVAAGWGVHVSIIKTEDELIGSLTAKIAALFPKPIMAAAPAGATPAPAHPIPSPRSFLAVTGGGEPTFINGINLRVGDQLGFNVEVHPVGPNPVFTGPHSMELQLVPDFSAETLHKAYMTFTRDVAEAKRSMGQLYQPRWEPISGEQKRFDTVDVVDDGPPGHRHIHIATQSDLDNLINGRKVAVLIASYDYKDGAHIHHLWVCDFLQPPALAPGIWQSVRDCPASD